MTKVLPLLLVLLLTGCARFTPPKSPKTELHTINDSYWRNQANWPTALTNGFLTYQRVIELMDKDHTIVTSYQTARASGKRYHAYFILNGIHLLKDSEHKLANESQTFYGPDFEWLPDGRLRSKSFHYGDGHKEHHWLDANGRPVKSIYDDYQANSFVLLGYDARGAIALHSLSRDDPGRPYQGREEYFIGNRKTTGDEFLTAFKRFRLEDIVGNQKK